MSTATVPRQFLTDVQREFIKATYPTESVAFFNAMFVLIGPHYTDDEIRSIAVMVRLILRSGERREVRQVMFDLLALHDRPEDMPAITRRARSLFLSTTETNQNNDPP